MEPFNRRDLQEASRAFRWAARRAFRLGLQAGSGGNISLRLDPHRFLTKPTGIGLTECRSADLVLIDGQGRSLGEGPRPTKEVQTHLAVYQVRPEINGIVHYHAPYATAYAFRGLTWPAPTLHARRILKEIPLIAEYPEGSAELARAVAAACGNPEVVGLLLTRHGLIALGPSLRQAQYIAELMEESARIAWLGQRL